MPVYRPIASDLSYEVLQVRYSRAEFGPQFPDSSNQRLMPLPSRVAQFDSFIADREMAVEDSRLVTRRER